MIPSFRGPPGIPGCEQLRDLKIELGPYQVRMVEIAPV